MLKYFWIARRTSRSLWFRTTMYSLLGIATALLAAYFKHLIPLSWTDHLGEKSVDNLLTILASSMLAVTTFSLSILVGAYSSASSGVTPRATELLRNDTTANNALSTFLGAFLFSIVGIVALKTGVYEAQGRTLLFMVTIVVIALIVVTLVRWINYLAGLGRAGATIQSVEKIAVEEIEAYLADPYLGCRPWSRQDQKLPNEAQAVFAKDTGYVHLVDVAQLAEALEKPGFENLQVFVQALPGHFVSPGSSPLISVVGRDEKLTADQEAVLRSAFTIDINRTFNNDPRFGVVVLSEVGSRALSAAINDSGTVIDIVNRSIRVIRAWLPKQGAIDGPERDSDQEVKYSRIRVPRIELADVFDDFFPLIARDGAHLREVAIRLQKALIALSVNTSNEMSNLAHHHAKLALQRNFEGLDFGPDFEEVEAVHHSRWPK